MDVGCACGDNISKIAKQMPGLSFTAIDIIDEAIAIARKRFENLDNLVFRTNNFLTDDIGNLPDLILCLETLEHIEDNFLQVFIDRLLNAAQEALILSVPREPLWCLANIARFKYLSRLGNTPSHLQHWTKRSFIEFVSEAAKKQLGNHFEVIVRSPLKLWTIVLIIKHNNP